MGRSGSREPEAGASERAEEEAERGEAQDHGQAFERSVDEGQRRLERTWPSLFATGFVGGLDMGIGILALLVVEHETGSRMLGALAFTIGFIALTLAGSELFTENFFVPIAAMVARPQVGPGSLLRLWGGTLAANLAGGWVVMALIVMAFPLLEPTALHTGEVYPGLGVGAVSMASALLAGMVITLMTWMEHGSSSVVARVVAAVVAGFLLAAGPLAHAIVSSQLMFGALIVGAPFGYMDMVGMAAWISLWNLVGGVGLVTLLRLVQVGRSKVEEEKGRSAG